MGILCSNPNETTAQNQSTWEHAQARVYACIGIWVVYGRGWASSDPAPQVVSRAVLPAVAQHTATCATHGHATPSRPCPHPAARVQMSGRAGRRGMDDRGLCLMMLDAALDEATVRGIMQASERPGRGVTFMIS